MEVCLMEHLKGMELVEVNQLEHRLGELELVLLVLLLDFQS